MTKFPYDEFAKGFLEALLSAFGKVDSSYKIAAEVREVDVYFVPSANKIDRTDLGLLGKCANAPIVIEPFRNSVVVPQIRACMSKLYDLHADIFRTAKRDKQPEPKDEALPMLWVLTPTLSDNLLVSLGATLDVERGEGVYLLPSAQKTGIVVIHRLPRTPETLWFRLLGKDGVQAKAIEEVVQLPSGHPYRQNTLELLGNLKVTLEARTNIEPEDRDLIMQLSPLYLEQIEAAKQEGEQRGKQLYLEQIEAAKQEGEQRGKQEIALNLMRKNIPLETIADATGLTIEQLQQLQSN